MTGNDPIESTYAEVAAVLRNMADHVEIGDSFEGSLEYSMPDVPEWAQRGEPEPEGFTQPEVMLRAAYRIGNTMGQGGMRIIGSMNPPRPAAPATAETLDSLADNEDEDEAEYHRLRAEAARLRNEEGGTNDVSDSDADPDEASS